MLYAQAADGRVFRNDPYCDTIITKKSLCENCIYLTMGENNYSKQLTLYQRERSEE